MKMKRTVAAVALVIFGAAGCTTHVHIAEHVDDPGNPETHIGQCYTVWSYDDVHHGFLWLKDTKKNYFSGTYCLKKIVP